MIAFTRLARISTCLFLVAGAAVAAAPEEPHCPAATADNSSRFYSKDADSSSDRRRLTALAQTVVQSRSQVCLLALMDPTGSGYSKKLAIDRVGWMRRNLTKEGVPINAIGYELRPAQKTDDPDIPSVLIIVGR